MISARKSKYNNEKVKIDGIKFDSKVESMYYLLLKDRKEKGEIKEFKLQPRYILQDSFKLNGENIRKIEYVADFEIINDDDTVEIVDIKGMATSDAKLKRKLFLFKYPNLKLHWLVYVVKRGGWICYFKNEKMKKNEKKKKLN